MIETRCLGSQEPLGDAGKRTGRRARRQTNEKLGGLGRARRVRCARVSPKLLRKSLPNYGYQSRGSIRLADKMLDSVPHRSCGDFPAVRACNDNPHLRSQASGFVEDLPARGPREREIEKEDIQRILVRPPPRQYHRLPRLL
jgi:hypothetical protein